MLQNINSLQTLFDLHQVHQFSNKQTEMALRVASLDYLGTVAARLRKDAVTSKMDQRSIDRILQQVQQQVQQLNMFYCAERSIFIPVDISADSGR